MTADFNDRLACAHVVEVGGSMEATAELVGALHEYLERLDGLAQRWKAWLDGKRQAIVATDIQRLVEVQQEGGALLGDIDGLARQRQQILQRAADLGVAAGNLRTLVRKLGRGCPAELRKDMQRAELTIQHLRRLHAATWILTNQLHQHAAGTLRLITAGAVETPVYNQRADCETGGGVLDTDA
ncbi:MAG: hypothetical protein D6753_17745 [Planctomycetota bacterium]|nr:MAG: hypothetical protein D6753_17745 [Planctomycetota bacterium]